MYVDVVCVTTVAWHVEVPCTYADSVRMVKCFWNWGLHLSSCCGDALTILIPQDEWGPGVFMGRDHSRVTPNIHCISFLSLYNAGGFLQACAATSGRTRKGTAAAAWKWRRNIRGLSSVLAVSFTKRFRMVNNFLFKKKCVFFLPWGTDCLELHCRCLLAFTVVRG